MSHYSEVEKSVQEEDLQRLIQDHEGLEDEDTIPLTEILDLDYYSDDRRPWMRVRMFYNSAARTIINLSPHASPSQALMSFFNLPRSIAYALVPQLLRSHLFNDKLPEKKISSTSWMDGLRGWAAVAVFNLHFFYAYDHTTVIGFGTTPESYWPWQLPVLELIYDGAESVIIFFLISGYVCSVKSLKMMADSNSEGLLTGLSGSIFRRGLRLYLPVLCSTLIITLLVFIGAYEPTRYLFDDRKTNYLNGPGMEVHPPRFDNFWDQLGYWSNEFRHMLDIWIPFPKDPTIDAHLWTIVYEFHASMHLYVVLAALSRCKTWIRIGLLSLILCWYAVFWHRWVSALYFGGAIIAQVDVLKALKNSKKVLPVEHEMDEKDRNENETARRTPNWKLGRHKWSTYCRLMIRVCLFGIALYLMSYPMRGIKHPSPLYKWINDYIPEGYYVKSKFPKSVGTLILVSLLTSSSSKHRSIWHRCLNHHISQYLGKIMFGFYLCHGTILHLFGYAVPIFMWRAMGGNDGVIQYSIGIGLGWIVSFSAALWAGDVFTREIDSRCGRAIKWLEQICFRA